MLARVLNTPLPFEDSSRHGVKIEPEPRDPQPRDPGPGTPLKL